MEKLLKFLRKLNSKELELVEGAIFAVKHNMLQDYNVKKLTGYSDIYRVKVRDIRIIFRKGGDKIDILDIGRRSEKTYREY